MTQIRLLILPRRFLALSALSALAILAVLVFAATGRAAPTAGTQLSISPPPAFGLTTVGEKSPISLVNLTNNGEGVGVEQIRIVGAAASEFEISNNQCGVLLEGGSCSLGLTFSPSGDPGGGDLEFTVAHLLAGRSRRLRRSRPGRRLQRRRAGEDFGTVAAGSEARETFTLTNSGEAPVQPGNFELFGPGSFAYSTGPSDCLGRPLAPSETCSLELAFRPNERRAYPATLGTRAGGEAFGVALEGHGGIAIFEPPQPLPDFGATTVGGAGVVRTVTMTNSGEVPASFFIAIISGGEPASFQLLDEDCTAAAVVPGASCSAEVRFLPHSVGPKTARLSLFGNGEGPIQVPLSGEGIAAQALLTPAALAFGGQTVGTASPPAIVSIRNNGAQPIETGAVAIVGPDIDQFRLAGDECTGAVIAVGGECRVHVRFTPDSAGAKAATLRIAVPGGVSTAALSGTAIAAGEGAVAATTAKPGKHRRHHKHHRRHRHKRHHQHRTAGNR